MVHNITLLANQTLKVPEQTVSEKSNGQVLKYAQTQVFCVLQCYTISDNKVKHSLSEANYSVVLAVDYLE